MTMEQKILSDIGHFYYEKNRKVHEVEYTTLLNKEDFNDEDREALSKLEREVNSSTEQEIKHLGITNVECDDLTNTVTITLEKPGVLIGQYGKNLEALNKFINNNNNIEIKIKEDKKLRWLYSFLYGYLDDEGAI